ARKSGHTILFSAWSSDVCSSDLWLERRPPDREDVFQATFLVLAQKAASIRDRKSVVWGKRVDLGGRRIIKKKKEEHTTGTEARSQQSQTDSHHNSRGALV